MLSWYLPAAPAVLAGACRWLGVTASFIDFNKHAHQNNTDIDTWAVEVLAHKPKLVALSIFSYKSKHTAEQLAKAIKKLDPGVQIVAGGSGIKDTINGKLSIDTSLVDFVIDGDGEVQWPVFLKEFFNLDTKIEFSELATPYSSYYGYHDKDFYQLSATQAEQKIWVPVTGSRGCVRKCTFCEVHQHWKFNQRDPKHIAQEIEQILSVFPTAHIHFTDSLVNGSLPAFYQLLDLLTIHKQQYPEFTWGGQFIIRNSKQCQDDYWGKIANSGGSLLEIGVETGSELLRAEMQKNFSNDDLEHSLTSMQKHGIQCVLLMFVGYPTETTTDFQLTLDMLTKYQSLANSTITAIQPGYNLAINPGSPLYDSSKTDPDMILTEKVHIWYNKNNPTLTADERLRRRMALEEHARTLGYTMSADSHISLSEVKTFTNTYSKIFSIIEHSK